MELRPNDNIYSLDLCFRYITSEVDTDKFSILKTVFGLKEDVIQDVKWCQFNIPDHQTNMYYVKRILENNLDDEEDVPDKDKLEEVLERSGFSEEKASELSQWLRRIDLFENQRLFYWVERYLDILNDTLPTDPYPHQPRKIEEPFEILDEYNIEEQPRENDEENPRIKIINILNKICDILKMNSRLSHIAIPCEDGYWYHGTSHKAAQSILDIGIDLSKGKEKQDFSDGHGFYLTSNFEDAKLYALENGHPDGSILSFQFNFGKSSLLRIANDKPPKGLHLTDDKEGWRCVVKHNRTGKATSCPKDYKKAEYVYGPMSNYKRNPSHPTEHKDFTTPQLCIKKEELAIAVRYALKEIFFFPSKVKKK